LRGELKCSCGEFAEAVEFFELASDLWFEGEKFQLWTFAVHHLSFTHGVLGSLRRALDFLEEAERRAVAVNTTQSLTKILDLQVFIAAELGEQKMAEEAVKKLTEVQATAHTTGAGAESWHKIPLTSLILEDGNTDDAEHQLDDINKPLLQLPKLLQEWTWGYPLFFAALSLSRLIEISRVHRSDFGLTKKLLIRMEFVCKKLAKLASVQRGLAPMSALCNGYLQLALGNITKACGSKGDYFQRAAEAGEMVLVAARAKMELAR
jgi:hypothetical protein